MPKLSAMLLLAALSVFSGSISRAASVTGYFTLDESLHTIPSQGTVTFTLNSDGTIAASLVTYGVNIWGFAFNTAEFLQASNFSTPGVVSSGWNDSFGDQESGISYKGDGLTDVAWTIGLPNEFSSVMDVFDGSQSSVDFVLLDKDGAEYGGDIAPSAVPEPGSFLLLGTGAIAGLLLLQRKRPFCR